MQAELKSKLQDTVMEQMEKAIRQLGPFQFTKIQQKVLNEVLLQMCKETFIEGALTALSLHRELMTKED